MVQQYRFNNHADFVAACEQLADDGLSFVAYAPELMITVFMGTLNATTKAWLKTVTQ